MKNKAVMLAGFAFISMNAYSIDKQLLLTTNIDINNLYTDSITSVEFEPAILELTLNNDNSGFEATSTTMKVSTNIPMDVSSVSYTSTMIQNTSTCTNFTGESFEQDVFVQVMFDGQPVTNENPSVLIEDFNSNDGTYKYSEHAVNLGFKSFSEVEMNGAPRECHGEIAFTIGVDI
ncbi:TPA: hypothetical protein ACOJPH_004875 [Vibrio campbellii]|uniref:hypothetical protein n=1 Tax=Vibrio campbellii TaxID=680 RepID=UPI00390A0621